MHFAFKTVAASALALAAAAPVAAQPYGAPASSQYGSPYGSPYRPTDQYQQQQRQYDRDRARWESQQDSYRAARADYDRRRADYDARRARYDARYGSGAYARAYGPAPAWDDRQWASNAPAADYYGSNAGYAAPIKCNNNSAVTAGLLGAIAGGVLGSNVAGRGDRTEGAVLGGLVGGGLGAAVGHANDKSKCDQQGAYWSYGDTVPYQVDNSVYRDTRSSYYSQRGCRLAPAPVNSSDYRYVRVCPDGSGRYRVAG
ncbi:glycine zipper 2TM domain-containing protein [Phenylobacterium sp. LjRoot219]|uniref:glycine zipper 2TM domain-containing protein n=1 Tax=Phenylobacterium sp. LjRoot219 TaxID=3342283 RepID=UPI003ECCC5F0